MAERVAEGEASACHSNLAAEVLQISNLLAQQASDKTGGSYKFSINDFAEGGDESFELNRDDALQLIGVLNSKESDIARRELSSLLSRMDRSAVEGMVRRLYGVLQRKNKAISQLETEAAKKSAKGAGRTTSLPQTERKRSGGLHTPRDNHSLPGAVEQGAAGQKDATSVPRSPRDSCGGGPLLSPRRAKEGGQLEQFKLMQEQQQAEYLRRLRERAGLNQERSPRSPRSPRDGPMPQVFRRLTAPATPPSDQMARIAVANMGANKAQVSFGGPLAESTDASQYLDALLEAHREEVRTDDDIYAYIKQSPRVSEEKAREIFDRLYKNGKDARIRRRVYAELGLLVEQAKEAQMCTFEPRLPLARYPDGFQPQESINERLYRDSFDRRRRREEAKQSMPVPTFRPNMSINSTTSRRSEGGVSPRDTLDSEGGFAGGLISDGSMNRKQSPLHERLYREHADRKARQAHREDAMADWRKHTFKPDIRNSQATGPQIERTGNFFEQLERSRAEDTDGYMMPGGRPLVPLRTMTHPAFEQELSDEEDAKQDPAEMADAAADEGAAPDSPAAPEMSSIEVGSPFEASSYKLNPATVEVAEAEQGVLDITHVAVPALASGDQTKETAKDDDVYEMPAADKLSAVCQELKVEAGEAEGESAPVIPRENHQPDTYVPGAQVYDQRRQWVQTVAQTSHPQLPVAAAVRTSSGAISRQESAYSLSQGGNSPGPMPCRHFSGHILTPRDSGRIPVAVGRAPSMPMAYVATGSSGPAMAVRTPSMHSQSTSSIAGSTTFAAWPGSGRLPQEQVDGASAALPESPRAVLSPRAVASPRVAPIPFVAGGPVARPSMVVQAAPQRYVQPQVMHQVPFQQPQMHAAVMSPRGPWQVPAATTHRL